MATAFALFIEVKTTAACADSSNNQLTARRTAFAAEPIGRHAQEDVSDWLVSEANHLRPARSELETRPQAVVEASLSHPRN